MTAHRSNKSKGAQPFLLEPKGMQQSNYPKRTLRLGMIDLKGDGRPMRNRKYNVLSAGDAKLEILPVPDSIYKKLNLDLYAFYIDNLPDFTKNNEGLLKVTINTKNPQDLSASEQDATLATNFRGKDGSYAPTFLYRGIFRNIIIENWINLQFDLYELDSDAEAYFNKVKEVVNGVPEIKNIDILQGIPYLNLATSLFESIINVFGKNSDDYIWGDIPLLAINPTIGGAFLRSGIYVLYEEKNSNKETISLNDIEYVNERVRLKKGSKKKTISNHLIFGIQLNSFVQQISILT